MAHHISSRAICMKKRWRCRDVDIAAGELFPGGDRETEIGGHSPFSVSAGVLTRYR